MLESDESARTGSETPVAGAAPWGTRAAPPTMADGAPAAPPTTTGGFRGNGPRRRIDYLLVTREWEVGEAAVAAFRHHRRLPSDHWPVVATLRLPPEA